MTQKEKTLAKQAAAIERRAWIAIAWIFGIILLYIGPSIFMAIHLIPETISLGLRLAGVLSLYPIALTAIGSIIGVVILGLNAFWTWLMTGSTTGSWSDQMRDRLPGVE